MLARASNWRPERLHVIAIGLWRLRAGCDKSRPPTQLEYRKAPLRNVAADRIENGVAIGHHLGEISGVVVDNFICPDIAQIGMVWRAGGRDHTCADMLGKLNGKAGDPARPALDQDRLSRLQFQCVLDGTHCGEAAERQGRGVNMRQGRGFVGDNRSLDRDLLGVRTLLTGFANAKDLVAHLKICDPFADGADHAGKIST